MEVVDPAEVGKHHHVWLEWLGLEEPPPEPDSWVVVARAFETDTPENSSSLGSRLVQQLTDAGIAARQRLYESYDGARLSILAVGEMLPCVAVLVHDRDLRPAVDIARTFRDTLEREQRVGQLAPGLSEVELTRQALQAGPPPPD